LQGQVMGQVGRLQDQDSVYVSGHDGHAMIDRASTLMKATRLFRPKGYTGVPTSDVDMLPLMPGQKADEALSRSLVDKFRLVAQAVQGSTKKASSLVPKPGESLKPYQIYALYAEKKSNSLRYDPGFLKLLDHLGVKMNGEKKRQLFVRYSGEDALMSYKEFESCYEAIQDLIVEHTMKLRGITKGRLIFLLTYAIFLLLLIFVFIFVGVAAFTGAGTLGAIVNSLLAAGSGIALNLKGKKEEENEEAQKETVKIGDKEYSSDGTETGGTSNESK
jgi:hypothetical protein